MDEKLAHILSIGNYVNYSLKKLSFIFDYFFKHSKIFTTVFAVEVFLKMIALKPKIYLSKMWNVFDTLIVILSLLDLMLEGVKGFSILRSFRMVLY